MAEYPRNAPNIHAVCSALHRGVGAARARGMIGFEPLLEVTMAELDAWAAARPGYRYDRDAACNALLVVSGGAQASLWTDPNPAPEPLPEGLEALVCHAVTRWGAGTMWSAPRERYIANPKGSWRVVARLLRENGGPDPRPYWLAEAIEHAAAAERIDIGEPSP